MRKINPEVVHYQGIAMGFPALFAKLVLRHPYIVCGQGSDVYLYPDTRLGSIFLKLVLKNANAVIALTADMKRRIESFFPATVFIIPNGVDVTLLNNISRETVHVRLESEKKFYALLTSVLLKESNF